MRYDTEVYFRMVTPGAYNPNTGDYDETSIQEEKRLASVTDAGLNDMRLVYGELRKGAVIVRLQGETLPVANELRIGDKLYHIDDIKAYKPKATLYASEVM